MASKAVVIGLCGIGEAPDRSWHVADSQRASALQRLAARLARPRNAQPSGLLLFVDQLRRLISHAIVNGTIRQALKSDPTSVPLLVEKLEKGRRLPSALVGWVMVAGASALEGTSENRAAFEVAAIAGTIGIFILAYVRWINRTAPEK